jgi:TolB-like protein/Tfp pilus assembly protein PilF
MKKCPQCGREYDNTMSFCLDDGAELLYGPASTDEPATAILHSTDAPAEAATRAQIHTTERTAVLSSGISEVPATKAFDKRLILAPFALAVIALGGFFGYRYVTQVRQIESIAVMPFVNESGNTDVEYLSDGMTETLIKSLSKMPSMDVKPRSAVFRYKGKATDLATIGKELNVQAILNGHVNQRGDQLTLSLELVDVQRNRVIWTEQYQRRQADVVSLQSEIAKDVSAELSPRLSGADETKVSKQATADPAAYQAYLRGRYYWNKRTGDDTFKAIEQFQTAIDRDPNYALAFAGLADSYSILRDYASNAPSDSMERSESFARQAIAIDGQLAEPHATLGNVYSGRWQWAESETAYKRAIELNPNYATAYHWYSLLLFALGRNEEAAAAITRAYQIDPMSNIISQNYVQLLRMKNEHKAVIEACDKIIDVDPNFPGGHFVKAWSYLKTGRNDEAIASFQKAAELNGRISFGLADLGAALAASGRKKEAYELIKELEGRYQNKQSDGYSLATIYAALGDKDKAFEWLEKDFSARSAKLPEVRWTINFEPLRNDPRFKDLIWRMGLPE